MSDQSDKQEDTEATIYELYCQLVEPQQAKLLTRFLIEWCNCDENTYPFLLGLLMTTHLRLGANLPQAVADKIGGMLAEFQITAQALIDAVGARRISFEREQYSQAGWWAWPLSGRYENKLFVCFQSLVKRAEQFMAYRVRWLLLVIFAGVSVLHYESVHLNEARLEQVKGECVKQIDDLKEAQAAKENLLQNQYSTSLEQRADELANIKVQNLKPEHYCLAEELAASSRPVKFDDNTRGWEVKIHETPGVPYPRIIYEPGLKCTVVFWLRQQNGRMKLSATAPAASPSNRSKTAAEPSQ